MLLGWANDRIENGLAEEEIHRGGPRAGGEERWWMVRRTAAQGEGLGAWVGMRAHNS